MYVVGEGAIIDRSDRCDSVVGGVGGVVVGGGGEWGRMVANGGAVGAS